MINISGKHFLVMGRAGLDLYPDPVGTQISTATTFTSALGGSSGNIAAGLARLGADVGLFSKISDDAVGHYTLEQCHHYGIETRYVSHTTGEERTTLALSESRIENTQTVIYRNNAADLSITPDDVSAIDWNTVGALIFTGTSLAKEPSRSATLEAIRQAHAAGAVVLFDVDYRAYSWATLEEATAVCSDAAIMSEFVIGNDDEFGVLAGSYEQGQSYASDLAVNGNHVSIYKMGSKGSVAYSRDSTIQTGIYPVEPLKPTGAGDAFMASFAHTLSNGHSLEEAVKRGSAAAAIVVTRVGCAPAMPTFTELDAFLSSHTLSQPE